MLQEVVLRKSFFPTETEITSIYFGGGTPSILENAELKSLLDSVHEHFQVSLNVEVTLETNPDDISERKLDAWKAIGVNRLSIGIQSFQDRELKLMNRAHNATEAIKAISLARRAGFKNITIDLIYGTPDSTLQDWEENLQAAIDVSPEHISAYLLTIEPKTALAYRINKTEVVLPEDELIEGQFTTMLRMLSDAGYDQYEISNFAKPGFASRHNSSYWEGKSYLGIGPSAHSFFSPVRSWNIANNAKYIRSLNAGKVPSEQEILTLTDIFNEYVMTGLRKASGISLDQLRELSPEANWRHILTKWEQQGALILVENRAKLTLKGKLISDTVISDLFIT